MADLGKVRRVNAVDVLQIRAHVGEAVDQRLGVRDAGNGLQGGELRPGGAAALPLMVTSAPLVSTASTRA